MIDKPNSRKTLRHSSFKSLGAAIHKPAASLSGKRGFYDRNLINHWPDFVGDDIAALCRPRSIKRLRRGGSVLVLECMSAYASELSMREEEIRMRINGALGHEAVIRIELHHQHLGFDQIPPKADETQKPKTRAKDQKLAKDLLGDIDATHNNELRAALEAVTKTYYQQGKNDG